MEGLTAYLILTRFLTHCGVCLKKEKAELDSAKAQAALTKAQATQTYVDMQVLDPQEVRRSLAESDEYQIDEVLSEDDLGLDDMAANLPTGVEQQLPDEPQNQEVSPEESQEETTDAVEGNERQRCCCYCN